MLKVVAYRGVLHHLSKSIDSSFFFYDLDHLSTHIQKLQNLPVMLWYTLKVNPLSSIIQVLDQHKMRFDVASIGELDQVLLQDVSPDRILHTGPAKSRKQLEYFLTKGVKTYVIESQQQLEDLSSLLVNKPDTVEVLLRVQLQWENGEENILGGQCVTPFGLSPDDWVKVLRGKKADISQNLNIIGFHCFQWGNILDVSQLLALWQSISAQLMMLAERLAIDAKVIDLGGGLGVPYCQDEQALTVESITQILYQLKHQFPKVEYWLELGRYAVAESGIYVVEDRAPRVYPRVNERDGGILHA